MSSAAAAVGSASIAQPAYWWYQARENLLESALGPYVGDARRLLDVGSADGPSARWLRGSAAHVALDIDPRGLVAGGVCGSAMALPFPDATFDVVAAFDVVEHCDPEAAALAELARVLVPGGRLLLAVPAYQWAWTHFDDQNGHHRRYTRRRAVAAVETHGLTVERATYAFMSVFPVFAAERLSRRLTERLTDRRPELGPGGVPPLPRVAAPLQKLLMALCGVDRRLLPRHDLPVGSSVLLAATKRG